MNSYGTLFKVTLYGESHQEAIGVVVDGIPAGTKIDLSLIEADLKRRRPGDLGTTARIETDQFRITSGVFNGYATGSPIHLMIENSDIRSEDYAHLKKQPRPGHADFVAEVKYKGYQDHRGGGRFSGRLTAAIVAAGALAKRVISYDLSSQIIQLGTLKDLTQMETYLQEIIARKDSVGGVVELTIKGLPVGIGEPFFNKLDAEMAKMLFSIPAVKGVSFGVGFEGAGYLGSQFNDAIVDEKGRTMTNHSGGVTGGISNGNDLVIKIMVKPTSSIQKSQDTYDFESKHIRTLDIGGRHDVAIIRRIGVVLENAAAIVLADLYLMSQAYGK